MTLSLSAAHSHDIIFSVFYDKVWYILLLNWLLDSRAMHIIVRTYSFHRKGKYFTHINFGSLIELIKWICHCEQCKIKNHLIDSWQDSCSENFKCLHHLHFWRATCTVPGEYTVHMRLLQKQYYLLTKPYKNFSC